MLALFNALLITSLLGVQLNFSPNIKKDCKSKNEIDGCYYIKKNAIYINSNSKEMESTIYHELGHALFYGNKEAINIVHDLKPISKIRTSDDEKIADYFAEYMLLGNFDKKYPSISKYFSNKMEVFDGFGK